MAEILKSGAVKVSEYYIDQECERCKSDIRYRHADISLVKIKGIEVVEAKCPACNNKQYLDVPLYIRGFIKWRDGDAAE